MASRGGAPSFSSGTIWATSLTNADDDHRTERILAAYTFLRGECERSFMSGRLLYERSTEGRRVPLSSGRPAKATLAL
jgi:hypothetical protein